MCCKLREFDEVVAVVVARVVNVSFLFPRTKAERLK